nr:PREDICTED: interferon-related developmental regulator 2 isoform X1 [Tribolium castaneum]|eukprot:XP_015838666.1 PREDICTED: interferon-related developmental regulator 2 isoform X1 [Tribolium castaneum]
MERIRLIPRTYYDRGRFDGSLHTSDDDSYNDNNSVISSYSENKSLEDGEDIEEFAHEQFEDKLIEMLDGLSQKSSQGRINCIQSLRKALIKKYVPNFVKERHFTICDSIEKSLKKGGGLEKAAAAELAPLISVQLGEEDAGEIVDKTLRPVLMTVACDGSVGAAARAKCCLALGMMGFLSGRQLGDTLSLMQNLETIFSASYLKGDGSIPNVTAEVANLHAAALSAWTLLLTNMPLGSLTDLMDSKALPSLDQLSELLESPHLEVRLTAGEALALIFEEGRKDSADFADDFAVYITDVIKKLATDSHKYRAKKDRKQQRATFRDILSYIEDDVVPDVTVKFGREVLMLDTWARRKQYDALCTVLGPGINIHLGENDLLRDIFEITAPIVQPHDTPAHAQQHMERCRKRLLNAAAFKARTISRAKNRDKRSDF